MMRTTLEDALVRWSVVSAERRTFAAGYDAALGPFLAGWFTRDMGASAPEVLGMFASSWRAGWEECSMHLRILARQEPHLYVVGLEACATCGLGRSDLVHQVERETDGQGGTGRA